MRENEVDTSMVVSGSAAPIATPVELPEATRELIDKAGDLDAALKALDDAVSMARGLWLSFISLSAYFLVAVGSVTHDDLFLESPLQLPLVPSRCHSSPSSGSRRCYI